MKKTKKTGFKKSSKRGEQVFRELNRLKALKITTKASSFKSNQKLARKNNYN